MSILAAGVLAGAGIVRECRSEGEYVVFGIEAPQIAAAAQPGQFVSVAQRAGGHILRRPFSILTARDDRIFIGFDVVGEGTAWLAGRAAGSSVEITGPLGKACTPMVTGTALLIGGGYGAAPMIFMAEQLRGTSVRTNLLLGAATKSRLFLPETARGQADELTITTDDGSAGIRGRVTDAMATLTFDAVYACGPMPMLAAVARATPPGIPVEVAVEEFMACGIGICWTCVVPTHEDGYRRHVRSCIEGPVFDGKAIAWA